MNSLSSRSSVIRLSHLVSRSSGNERMFVAQNWMSELVEGKLSECNSGGSSSSMEFTQTKKSVCKCGWLADLVFQAGTARLYVGLEGCEMRELLQHNGTSSVL